MRFHSYLLLSPDARGQGVLPPEEPPRIPELLHKDRLGKGIHHPRYSISSKKSYYVGLAALVLLVLGAGGT